MRRIVGQRYELISAVGRGPTGLVWRARHLVTGEDVALKVLDARFARDAAIVDRFVQQQQVLGTFVHPVLLRMRDLVADEVDLAVAAELVDGSDLSQEIRLTGPLAPDAALPVVTACADALAAAHAVGMVHCDIKPTNILLPGSGEPRLTDFRVARLARGYLDGWSRFGHPQYAAPEVIEGGPPVAATDVYGLGLVLYETLLGVPLCSGGDPAQVLRQHLRPRPVALLRLPPPLDEIVEASLAVDPAERPTAEQLAVALREVLAALGPRAAQQVSPAAVRQPGPPTHAAAPPRRPSAAPAGRSYRLLTIALAALLAALAGLAFAYRPTTARDDGGGGGTAGGSSRGDASGRAAPQRPDAADATTGEGGEAFTRYWFATLDYAVATGDTRPLAAVSQPDCRACAGALGSVRKGYGDGARIQGGQVTVRGAAADNFFSVNHPRVLVVFDRAPYSVVDAGRRRTANVSGVTFADCQVLLNWTDDGWRMREITGTTVI